MRRRTHRGRRLGLSGWVRNLPDGSVEVAASGDAGQLELLRGELLRGPRGAVISELQELRAAPDPEASETFDIIR